MEITWNDSTSLSIKGKTALLLIDPDRQAGKLKGDVVLSSSEELKEEEGQKVFNWPGEYEVKDIPIVAMESDGGLIFCFEVEGVKMCHIGSLEKPLSSDMVKEIGDVDILMIDASEGKKAMEAIEAIEPRMMIPIGYKDAESLKSVGASGQEVLDKFVIKSTSELPEDQMKCVVLSKS